MTEAYLLELGQRTLVIFLQLAGPILLFSLGVGLLVSILQAVTQIQDMTITFIPKILATLLALAIFGPWMLQQLVRFTVNLFDLIPYMVR